MKFIFLKHSSVNVKFDMWQKVVYSFCFKGIVPPNITSQHWQSVTKSSKTLKILYNFGSFWNHRKHISHYNLCLLYTWLSCIFIKEQSSEKDHPCHPPWTLSSPAHLVTMSFNTYQCPALTEYQMLCLCIK